MRNLLSLALAGALLAGGSTAQTTLVGLGETSCPSPYLGLATQKVCAKPTWCMTLLKPNPALWAGATTWDDTLNAAWVSNGSAYGVVRPSACINPCKCKCQVLCLKMWPIKNYITGMAMNSAKRILYISDSNNTIRTYRVSGPCKITQAAACRFRLPYKWYVTGLAYDKVHDYLFIVTSSFNPLTVPVTVVYVSKASSPCNPFCKWQLPKCPKGVPAPATGLAFDPGTNTLFVSDTKGWTHVVKWDGKCAFKAVSCCPSSPVKRYYGLGLKAMECPPRFDVSLKPSWASSPCPNVECQKCDPVPGYAGGAPVVGNLNFRLTLAKGPNPRKYKHFAFILLNFADHCKIQRLLFPCGPIYLYPVPDPWFHSALAPTMSTPFKCGLSAAYKLPIPRNPALKCLKFCGQWMVFNLRTGMPPSPWCLTATRKFEVRIGG